MTNVENPILFTGYYPHIPATDSPQPVTSTTPNYHNILVRHLTATGATSAGDVVGVPEEPFYNICLNSVQISATTGLVVRNATITTSGNTTITVSSGSPYIIESNGYVN